MPITIIITTIIIIIVKVFRMKTAPDIEMDMFPSLKKKFKKINVRNYAHGIKWLKKSYNEKEKEQKKKKKKKKKKTN